MHQSIQTALKIFSLLFISFLLLAMQSCQKKAVQSIDWNIRNSSSGLITIVSKLSEGSEVYTNSISPRNELLLHNETTFLEPMEMMLIDSTYTIDLVALVFETLEITNSEGAVINRDLWNIEGWERLEGPENDALWLYVTDIDFQ